MARRAIISDSLNDPIVAPIVTRYQTRLRSQSGIGSSGSIRNAKIGG